MRSTKRGGKGRNIVVQPGQTLHHFFKNAAPQQRQNHGNSSKFTSTQKEIIVIDSDSDSDDKLLLEEESSTKPAKRCRLSDDAVVVDIDLTMGGEEDWDDDRSFEFNDNWMLNPSDNNEIPAISSNPQPLQVSDSSSSSCMVTQQTLVGCDGNNVKPDRNNAFSILMSSVKETEAWKEASLDNKTSSGGPPQTGNTTTSGRRKVPFYKVLQGMPIAVDAFNFGKIQGVTAYFLTSVLLLLLLSQLAIYHL